MYLRTYFDKDNVIIKDTSSNLGRNPIGELFYGGTSECPDYSRYIFHFPLEKVMTYYNNCLIGDLTKTTHKINITPTAIFKDPNCPDCNKSPAVSFDLILFRLGKEWDEGCGYDLNCANCPTPHSECNDSTEASNWFNATSLSGWTEEGIYSGSPVVLLTQHFDCDHCPIELDVTDIVNDLITGATLTGSAMTVNYGFGIAFSREIELSPQVDERALYFFTKDTQSYYEPFLETIYDNPIKDDRHKFYLDKNNKLYLYSNLRRTPVNLDETPSVAVYDQDGALYSAYTSTDVQKVSQGVYCVDLIIPSQTVDFCTTYTDVWSGIVINGVSRPDVTLQFPLLDDDSYYNVGSDSETPEQFGFSLRGIKRDERIKRGDLRKITISVRKAFSVNKLASDIDDVEYRLYIKEGNAEVTVIDWMKTNQTDCDYWFLLDTNCFIPQTYYLDVKVKSNLEVRHYCEKIKFVIENQNEICND